MKQLFLDPSIVPQLVTLGDKKAIVILLDCKVKEPNDSPL